MSTTKTNEQFGVVKPAAFGLDKLKTLKEQERKRRREAKKPKLKALLDKALQGK